MKHETLNLKEYRCRKCVRVFYINSDERSSLDMDFGCPFGCDDAGEHTRDIRTEITDIRGV